jgi:hypothetical protein
MKRKASRGIGVPFLGSGLDGFPGDETGEGDVAEEQAISDTRSRLGFECRGRFGSDVTGVGKDVGAAIDDGQQVRRVRSLGVTVAARGARLESARSDQCGQPADKPAIVHQPPLDSVGAGLDSASARSGPGTWHNVVWKMRTS